MISTLPSIGWIAGLLEGEGYFAYREPQGLTIQVSMTDEDVIQKLKEALGFGSITSRRLKSGKTAWKWPVAHQTHTAGLMMTLLPFMEKRRQ